MPSNELEIKAEGEVKKENDKRFTWSEIIADDEVDDIFQPEVPPIEEANETTDATVEDEIEPEPETETKSDLEENRDMSFLDISNEQPDPKLDLFLEKEFDSVSGTVRNNIKFFDLRESAMSIE